MTPEEFVKSFDEAAQRHLAPDYLWEVELIGSMIKSEYCLKMGLLSLVVEDFSLELTSLLFGVIADMAKSGWPVNRQSVIAAMGRVPDVATEVWAGAVDRTLKAADDSADRDHCRTLAHIVLSESIRRKTFETVKGIIAIELRGSDKAMASSSGQFIELGREFRRIVVDPSPDTLVSCLNDLASIHKRIAAIEATRAEEARRRRIVELKAMPYQQYLASPEWLATRHRMLDPGQSPVPGLQRGQGHAQHAPQDLRATRRGTRRRPVRPLCRLPPNLPRQRQARPARLRDIATHEPRPIRSTAAAEPGSRAWRPREHPPGRPGARRGRHGPPGRGFLPRHPSGPLPGGPRNPRVGRGRGRDHAGRIPGLAGRARQGRRGAGHPRDAGVGPPMPSTRSITPRSSTRRPSAAS